MTTNQMNRGDQLAALERLGVFRVGASRHWLFDERAAALGQVAAMLGRCRPSMATAIQKRFDTLVAPPLRRGIEKNGTLATQLPSPAG
ncbi:MAG: hypothetical protein U0797_23010 [Gemmataceae bacterium]